MARNHKLVLAECLKLASELNISLTFDNLLKVEFDKNGELTKDCYMEYVKKDGTQGVKIWANSVIIDNKGTQAIIGLQNWDNPAFRDLFMPALREYATHADITGHDIRTIADIEAYCKGSKTSTTRARGHVEYAKDSYHWAQIDLIDRFELYQESKMIFNFDDVESHDAFIDLENKQKQFFKDFYIKMNNCNPNPNFWTSERLETYYITSKILPKFIREELHADFPQDTMNMICKLYFQSRDEEYKTIASEHFADSLHRLINDEKLPGTVEETLKALGEE